MNHSRRGRALPLVGLFAIGTLTATGCGADAGEARRAGQDGYFATAPTAPSPSSGDAKGDGVSVDERIRAACNLPTAHFAFDSADVDTGARSAMDALAQCFVVGPLKGKRMRLVGHADPRADADYNIGLGHRRAAAVASYLKRQGVEDGQLGVLSRGAMDASGRDEAGWAEDRRVEILLGE